jgi:hypothetical protein
MKLKTKIKFIVGVILTSICRHIISSSTQAYKTEPFDFAQGKASPPSQARAGGDVRLD